LNRKWICVRPSGTLSVISMGVTCPIVVATGSITFAVCAPSCTYVTTNVPENGSLLLAM
jgi:hypothetical protein